METPRPGLEKLGAVRTDPDLIGLLFTLIYRATSDRQERAQNADTTGGIRAGKGLYLEVAYVIYFPPYFASQARVSRGEACPTIKFRWQP